MVVTVNTVSIAPCRLQFEFLGLGKKTAKLSLTFAGPRFHLFNRSTQQRDFIRVIHAVQMSRPNMDLVVYSGAEVSAINNLLLIEAFCLIFLIPFLEFIQTMLNLQGKKRLCSACSKHRSF